MPPKSSWVRAQPGCSTITVPNRAVDTNKRTVGDRRCRSSYQPSTGIPTDQQEHRKDRRIASRPAGFRQRHQQQQGTIKAMPPIMGVGRAWRPPSG